jgi:hypothetical protein
MKLEQAFNFAISAVLYAIAIYLLRAQLHIAAAIFLAQWANNVQQGERIKSIESLQSLVLQTQSRILLKIFPAVREKLKGKVSEEYLKELEKTP